MQLFPVAKVLPQGVEPGDCAKSPLVTMLVMSSVEPELLVSVTVFLALVCPTTTVPKVRVVGDTLTPVIAGFTVSWTVVVWVKAPDTPVMVTVNVPVAALPLAVRVSVLVVEVGFGLNPAVTPLGRPEALKLTLPVKPFKSFTVMVVVPLLP